LISLDCDAPSNTVRAAWFRRAASLSQQLLPVPSKMPLETMLGMADALAKDAPDAEARALAAHLQAQVFYANNVTTRSTAAFANAEDAWLAAHDSSRALAARIGRVEDLIRAGKYQDADRLVKPPFAVSETDRAFAMRLSAAHCLIARYLARLDEASACYVQAVADLRAAGEQTDLASMTQELADVFRLSGRRREAERRANEVVELAAGPYAPIVRGRARVLLADLALDRGDIAAALGEIDRALSEFAAVHATRWEANVMLRASSLYLELGAVEEARAYAASAIERLPPDDAPARFAAAEVAMARVDMNAGDFDAASKALRDARDRYAKLGMPVEIDVTETLVADVLLARNEYADSEAMARARDKSTSLNRNRWALIRARCLVERGDWQSAANIVNALRKERLSLDEQIDLSTLDGYRLYRRGDYVGARRVLLDAARRISAWTIAARNPLLREMLRYRIRPLRTLAVQTILDESEDRSRELATDLADELWQWTEMLNGANRATSTSVDQGILGRFDELVSQELLGSAQTATSADALARRQLFSAVSAKASGRGIASTSIDFGSLGSFRKQLGAGVAFVALLDGRTQGAALWITRDGVSLAKIPDARRMRVPAAALMELASRPDSSIQDLHAAAKELSTLLLATAPLSTQPSSILTEGASDYGAIAWPLLYWPGSSDDLITGTAVEAIRTRRCCDDSSSGIAPHIHVFTAAQMATSSAILPSLPAASVEAKAIDAAIAPGSASIDARAAHDRDDILRALNAPGEWVHIAAHGLSRPERIGFSGIWLEPAGDEMPAFLSGLDVLNAGVRSDLVVLDACRLGERGGDVARAELNFADAVSKAGADHVVTALWPVSDAASGIWVSTFYRLLAADADRDVERALHGTQLELRSRRAFRHPFYWASWSHTRMMADASPSN
jgi:CHAT domain-containing protein/tetratricopeptide (TPR) repeat protein